MSKESAWKKRKKEGVWVSPRYAGVAQVVMQCLVFVVFVSSRRIESAVVGLGRLGSGLRCGPGMLWSPLVRRLFSRCAQWFWFLKSGSREFFTVVGGWFSSGFRRVRWTNPPPSPNGEVGASRTGSKPQKGGSNIVLLKKEGKQEITKYI